MFPSHLVKTAATRNRPRVRLKGTWYVDKITANHNLRFATRNKMENGKNKRDRPMPKIFCARNVATNTQ